MRCRSKMQPPCDPAPADSPPAFTPEREDPTAADQLQAAAQKVSQSLLPQVVSKPTGDPEPHSQAQDAEEEMDIDVMNDAPPAQPLTSELDRSAAMASNAAEAREGAAASINQPQSTDEITQQKQHGAAKPTSIKPGSRLPSWSKIRKSHDFADAGSVKAALADAWSQDSDVGKQLAALYELFGDGILPYVPTLPCLTSAV